MQRGIAPSVLCSSGCGLGRSVGRWDLVLVLPRRPSGPLPLLPAEPAVSHSLISRLARSHRRVSAEITQPAAARNAADSHNKSRTEPPEPAAKQLSLRPSSDSTDFKRSSSPPPPRPRPPLLFSKQTAEPVSCHQNLPSSPQQ